MKSHLRNLISFSIICIFSLTMILINTGCEGTESRKSIDDTVKSAAGMDAVKKKEMIEKKLDESYKKEAERAQKGLDGDGSGASNDSQREDR
ncbi:MAG TPA: hypothetical protein VIS94_05905 [Desulfomonilia bacterium]